MVIGQDSRLIWIGLISGCGLMYYYSNCVTYSTVCMCIY